MLEPGPRYSPAGVGHGSRLQMDTAHLETAVDLSRKSHAPAAAAAASADIKSEAEADPEDSEDEAPLDLKVRPPSSSHDTEDGETSRPASPASRNGLNSSGSDGGPHQPATAKTPTPPTSLPMLPLPKGTEIYLQSTLSEVFFGTIGKKNTIQSPFL